MENDRKAVQQHVKVKQIARNSSLSLDIPRAVTEQHKCIKKDVYAGVSISEKPNKILLIYEFDKED